jgi:hypothetical protein
VPDSTSRPVPPEGNLAPTRSDSSPPFFLVPFLSAWGGARSKASSHGSFYAHSSK